MSRFTIDNRSSLSDDEAMSAVREALDMVPAFKTFAITYLGRRIYIEQRDNPKVDTFLVEDAA